MTTGTPAALVGLDWGTTSLRAHLLAADGTILDRRSSSDGILAVHKDGFEGTFRGIVGDWLSGSSGLPVIASGMITSRNGWVETPYVRVPGGIAELAASLVPFDTASGARIYFICGMDQDPTGGSPDIMRGEETQIVGCTTDAPGGEGLFVMPGTHSKWVGVVNGRLDRFDTYMTGEVFAVLKGHSILGRLMESQEAGVTDGFRKGVSTRLASQASLLRQIFSARTMVIYDRLKPSEAADYLSGLLIGEEVRAALEEHGRGGGDLPPVTVVGSGELTRRYGAALACAGIEVSAAPADAAAKGHFAIAHRAGLIGC